MRELLLFTLTLIGLSVAAQQIQPTDSVYVVEDITTFKVVSENTDKGNLQLTSTKIQHARSFAWGVEITGNIDMGCNDMSSFAFNAYFGMKAPTIPIIGVGAGVNVPIANSSRSIPVFAIVRTDFNLRKPLIFFDIRGGVSVNYLENNKRQTGGFFSPCLGINLAGGATYQSYLMAGYSFYERKNYYDANETEIVLPSLHLAVVRLGISF